MKKILSWIMGKFVKASRTTSLQENRYRALSPRKQIDNGAEYFNALNWAMQQEDVLNIAVSGPYGSGKSSVIESYFSSEV